VNNPLYSLSQTSSKKIERGGGSFAYNIWKTCVSFYIFYSPKKWGKIIFFEARKNIKKLLFLIEWKRFELFYLFTAILF